MEIASILAAELGANMNQAISFKSLSKPAMRLSAQIILGAADIVCWLWPDGDIAKVSLRSEPGEAHDLMDFHGRPMRDLIHADDVASLNAMIRDTVAGRETHATTLRHSALAPWGAAARYSAQLAGDGQKVILIGMSVAADLSSIEHAAFAEIALAQDRYMSDTVNRYRKLFEKSSEGLIVASAESGTIDMANRHAADLLGVPLDELQAGSLTEHLPDLWPPRFGVEDRCASEIDVPGDPHGLRSIYVTLEKVRTFGLESIVIRLHPRPRPGGAWPVIGFLKDQTEVPILLTDAEGTITWANGAARQMPDARDLVGRILGDVFSIPAEAFAEAVSEARSHKRVLSSLSSLGGNLADGSDAHVTIIGYEDREKTGFGVVLQPVLPETDRRTGTGPAIAERLEALVGHEPMRSLVQGSTRILERDCLEAALRLTGNNRTAAAKALGLSRQGLYSKLKQHDLI